MVLQPSISESPFEHPAFESLYARALRDVADRRLDERQRKAAARALAFLLRERFVDEAVATDVLTVLHRSLDVSKVVRTLLLGLVGVSAPEKIVEWTRAVADRALADGRLPSFISAMRILVELSGYDGMVPARWRISLFRAIEFRELASRVLLFSKVYASRFPNDSWWLATVGRHSAAAVLRRSLTAPSAREIP